MTLRDVLGQPTALASLERALLSGRRHHAYRFEGPEGVGKELAAFGVAQALVCERPETLGCGQCSHCRRAVAISSEEPHVPAHPDVLLIGRGVYPPAVLGKSEITAIGVEQIRKIVLSRVGYRPHEAAHLVFIIRDADLLTASAANALLKTLEEPGDGVQFLLVTSRPQRLLDTIRSRTLPLRFGPLPVAVLEQILEEAGRDKSVAPLAQGSASRALQLAEEEARVSREKFFNDMREAISARGISTGLTMAATMPKDRARVREHLLALAQQFSGSAQRYVRAQDGGSRKAMSRYEQVMLAVDALERNGHSQLVMEDLIVGLRRAP